MARPRVLVIDDEPHVRGLWCEFLRFLRCEPDEAAGPIEGLRQFQQGHYDLVVSDILMPGLTGWDLARAVRQAGDTPVILVSGTDTDLDLGLLKEPGIILLQKPINLADFRSVVEQLLRTDSASNAGLGGEEAHAEAHPLR